MTAIVDEAGAPARGIFGQPKGLYYLAATEAWERFSYYGMTALVVLYMVNQLLLPGHVENIAGFPGFRAALERVFGPMSTQALASQIFGLYSGFVYFTPVLGGWIADRFVGQRNAVVAGAVLMSAGHLAMAFDQSFLLALALLILGSGLLKGNISAQVGALYSVDDEANRVRGYTVFSMGINVGAVFGPIVCGLLAQLYGWHTGFGAAALFILIGLVTYLVGYRHLPARAERAVSVSRALTLRRVAAHRSHLRRAGDRRVSCDLVLPVFQHRRSLDPGSRQSRSWQLRHSRAVVQRGRSRCSRSSPCPWCSRSGAGRPRRAPASNRAIWRKSAWARGWSPAPT